MTSMPTRMLASLIVCASLCTAAFAQNESNAPELGSFHSKFDQAMKDHKVIGGAGALLMSRGTSDLHVYGDASNETHQKINGETSYNWASITKTMTAIAILQLRDRGKLSLDDPVVKYVPELREVHDAFGPVDAITIRHLLTHSAGFRNPTWPWDCDDPRDCEWQPFEPTRWSQIAAMLPYTHIAFKPGSRWSYSNLGYVFLGQVIERLSGDDFEVYVDKNILKPLDMTESYFDRAPYFLADEVSASYLRAGDRITAQPADFDTGITTSNSGLKAPITDMAKYLRFLIGESGNARYDVVLKRASLEEAWAGVVPVEEPGHAATAYTAGSGAAQPKMGLGFFVLESGGHKVVYHDGDQGGFSSELLIDIQHHEGSLLVVNTTDTGVPATDASHAQSNTEPDPQSDLRLKLRAVLLNSVFGAH